MTKQASVWAPYANTVDLVVGGRRSPMQRSGPDTFVCDKSPAHGEDYGFSLNGGPIIPDPRSPWQPSGVHGLSRGYDHSLFKWSTETWHTRPLFSTVLYELHVGTFTADGTFQAAIERLDHLRALGVTTIELMPVAQFPGARGWGYDGVDLFAVHSQYGGPDGLKSFVDACHVRDLTVMLDVVYNHVGPEGNYLDQFGPYINTRYRSPYGAAFNLDGPQSSPVRGFLIDNARWWVTNFRLDGLRLDAVNDILDTSANHFLLDLTRAVRSLEAALGRSISLVAEARNDPRLVLPEEAGGYGIHAETSDDFHHALHAYISGERSGTYQDFGALSQLALSISSGFVFTGQISKYRRRSYGAPLLSPDFKLVSYAQNHDQIGNRADGARLSELIPRELCKVAAGLTLLGPHIPMIFQGEEWAAKRRFYFFTDYSEEDVIEGMRAGRQERYRIFGWDGSPVDPQAESTFLAVQAGLGKSRRDRRGYVELVPRVDLASSVKPGYWRKSLLRHTL